MLQTFKRGWLLDRRKLLIEESASSKERKKSLLNVSDQSEEADFSIYFQSAKKHTSNLRQHEDNIHTVDLQVSKYGVNWIPWMLSEIVVDLNQGHHFFINLIRLHRLAWNYVITAGSRIVRKLTWTA